MWYCDEQTLSIIHYLGQEIYIWDARRIRDRKLMFASFFNQGSSPQAQALAKNIDSSLLKLNQLVQQAINSSEKSGVEQPAHTVSGRVEQAQKWLRNPQYDDHGLGKCSAIFIQCIFPLHNSKSSDIFLKATAGVKCQRYCVDASSSLPVSSACC